MDFITGLSKSKGHNVIMVVVDRLTKYVHFIELSHPFITSIVTNFFLENIQKLHGTPKVILVIVILSLLVTFGNIYSHVWVLNWLIVLHTIHNQMGKLRWLINV